MLKAWQLIICIIESWLPPFHSDLYVLSTFGKDPHFFWQGFKITLLGSHFTFMLQYRKLKPKWYINLKCFNQARIPGPVFIVQSYCLRNKLNWTKKPECLNQTHITRNDEVGKVFENKFCVMIICSSNNRLETVQFDVKLQTQMLATRNVHL